MILLKGKYAGSHKYVNCIRASECPLCYRCKNHSKKMTQCLKCYPNDSCGCTQSSMKIAQMISRKLKKAAYTPQSKPKPTSMGGAVEMYKKSRQLYEDSNGHVDMDKMIVEEEK